MKEPAICQENLCDNAAVEALILTRCVPSHVTRLMRVLQTIPSAVERRPQFLISRPIHQDPGSLLSGPDGAKLTRATVRSKMH